MKKDWLSALGEESFVGRKFCGFLQVLAVLVKIWCSRNILISFASESLWHGFLLFLLENWNNWLKTKISLERSSFQPRENLCPHNIWFWPIGKSLFLVTSVSSCRFWEFMQKKTWIVFLMKLSVLQKFLLLKFMAWKL